MRKTIYISVCLFFLFNSCTKSNQQKYCWKIVDNVGNDLSQVCDKTEQELLDCFKNSNCGIVNGGSGLNPCNYYIVESQTFCWVINGRFYKNMTAAAANHQAKCYGGGAIATKVDCTTYCQNWYNREERIYKMNYSQTYSSITTKAYCGLGLDTVFQSKRVRLRETSDSIINLQFSKDGVNW